MGSGSSSKYASKKIADESFTVGSDHQSLQRLAIEREAKLEEEVQFLRRAFDKEKVEKEWLMKRYDEDMKLRKEVIELRAQLAEATSSSSNHSVAQAAAADSSASDARGGARALSAVTDHEAIASLSPGILLSPGAGEGRGGSLKERRHIKLGGVVTAKRAEDVQKASEAATGTAAVPAAGAAAATSSTAGGADSLPVKQLQEKVKLPPGMIPGSKSLEFLKQLEANPARQLVEPMTDAGVNRRAWKSNMEPMSPMLKRRANFGINGIPDRHKDTGLQVMPDKLFKLDPRDLVPESPKRAPVSAKKRTGPLGWESDVPVIAEAKEEDENNSPLGLAEANRRATKE